MGIPTYFNNPTTVAARALEVVAADFENGMNPGASCAPGIGINMGEGAVVGTPEQFTLLDQAGAVREPQDSSYIGGTGLGDGAEGPGLTPILSSSNIAADGTPTQTGTANLETLANGWVETAVVP